MKKNSFVLTALIIAAAVAFVSCTQEKPAERLADDFTVIEESMPYYIPEKGGELDIAIPEGVESFNPLTAVNEDIINMLGLVYETPLLVDQTGKFEPCLVETWTVDSAGTTYEFHSRAGVKFHNGNSMTMDDIYYTIGKIYEIAGIPVPHSEDRTEPELTVGTAENITAAETPGNDNEDGEEEIPNRFTIYLDLFSAVDLVDETTLRITMTRPGREALYFMTFPILDSDTSMSEMIGTGPYVLSGRGSNNELVFDVNADWWKTAPYISKIVAKRATSQEEKKRQFNERTLNFYSTPSIASGKQKQAGFTQIIDYNTNYYDCLVPNLFNDCMKSDGVRKAVSYAVNRRDIISSVMQNHAIVAEIPMDPNFFAFNVKYKLYEYDKSVCRDLLEEAGYGTEPDSDLPQLEISLIVPSEIGYEYRLEVARVIAEQLASVGIVCDVQELSANEYLRKLENKDFDLAYCSYYLGRNPDVSFMLETGRESNYGNVASKELDSVLASCRTAVTEEEIIDAYDAFQQYFVEKVPQIGLFYRTYSTVSDFSIKEIGGMYENYVFAYEYKWSIDKDSGKTQ